MNIGNRFGGVLVALSVVGVSALAQTPPGPGPSLDRLVGRWILTGTIQGKATTHDVDAEWVLNRGYVRVHEVSREKDAKGGPAYEAIVFISWDQKASEYTCLWLDSTASGGLSADGIGRGKPVGDSIPFVWKAGGGDSFRNTFVYSGSAGTWQWNMDNVLAGKAQPFARLRLARR